MKYSPAFSQGRRQAVLLLIKVISFDLDGTLVTRELEEAFWNKEITKLYARQHKIPFAKAKKIWEAQVASVSKTRMEWFDPGFWFKRLKLKKSHKALLRDLKHLIRIYPETKRTLRKLRAMGFKTIIISNAHRDFLDLKIEATGLKDYFEEIYSLPSDFNTTKRPSIYKKIASRLGVKPGEILHAGDFYEEDFLIPIKAGLKAVHINRKVKFGRKGVVKNLEEICNIVKEARKKRK